MLSLLYTVTVFGGSDGEQRYISVMIAISDTPARMNVSDSPPWPHFVINHVSGVNKTRN